VLPEQRDRLGAQALDLEQLESRGRVLGEQLIAALERAARGDFLQRRSQPLADAGDVGDLAPRVAKDVLDALGVAFDGRCAVAIAADAEGVLGGDLHEVGGLREQPRDLAILHGSIVAPRGLI